MTRPARTLSSVASLLIVVSLLAVPGEVEAGEVPTRASFTWSMAQRTGLDRDGDGRIEIENSLRHVTGRSEPCPGCPPQRFRVTMTARPSPTTSGLADASFDYEWRIAGPTGYGTYFRSSPVLDVRLPEGEHAVELRVRVTVGWGSVTLLARDTIEVDDVVVVALGDSYASGEGNPDEPRFGDDQARWADASDPAVELAHALAHRSSVGWPSRVANFLEVGDPHTSVTFVDLAASSARIGAGILGPHAFLDIPGQLDDLAAVLGDRTIDVLLIQIGGNDVGFSQVIRQLVEADPFTDPICYDRMVENVWASVRDGRWDRDVSLGYDPPVSIVCRSSGGISRTRPGLDGLAAEFDLLASALARFEPARTFLIEYPDPSGSKDTGETCEEIVGDTTPPLGFHEVDEREQQWARDRVLAPLNAELAFAAARHGWSYVGGVADAFLAGHGYCAPWPDYGYPESYRNTPSLFRDRLDHPSGWYRVPGGGGLPFQATRGDVTWYRTASQSAVLQGPTPRFRTAGTLHPNELGHAAMARLVLTDVLRRG